MGVKGRNIILKSNNSEVPKSVVRYENESFSN